MRLGRDLLTALVLDLKFSDNVIICGGGPYKGCLSPMVDVINHDFKYITDKTVKLEELFVNSYVDKLLESNSPISSTHRIRRILDEKYKTADLNKLMTEQCQHLTATESHILLNPLNNFKDLFGGTLSMWKTTPVYLGLKDGAKPVCSRSYPVPKLHEAMFKSKSKDL